MATAQTITPSPTEQRNRHRRLILTAAIAAALIVVGVVVLATRDDATEVGAGAENTAESPEEIGDGFLNAYRRLDLDQTVSYLAPDILLSVFEGREGLASGFSLNRATGFELLPGPCEEQDTTSSGTRVRCPYEFHGIRSAEAGLGPYGDNYYDFTVLDGRIVSFSDHIAFMTNGFSDEMWKPFAAWVSETYPDDASVMYSSWPSINQASKAEDSLRLWEQRSQEYVQQLSN